VYDIKVLVGKGPEVRTERVPLAFEKDIDGYAAVALPPPYVGEIQKQTLEFGVVYVAKIIDGGDAIVAILYYAHVFHTGVYTQRDKGVFGV
jgi:hypothetical protein